MSDRVRKSPLSMPSCASQDKVGYPAPWLERIADDTGESLRLKDEPKTIHDIAIGPMAAVAQVCNVCVRCRQIPLHSQRCTWPEGSFRA